jgi:hypothetical protein
MAKKKKSSGDRATGRTRINPLTGQAEQVSGTRSGKNRQLLPYGHPLRTHDLKPAGSKKKRHEALMKRNELAPQEK